MKRRVAPPAAISVARTQRILPRSTGPCPLAGDWLRTWGNPFGGSEHRR